MQRLLIWNAYLCGVISSEYITRGNGNIAKIPELKDGVGLCSGKEDGESFLYDRIAGFDEVISKDPLNIDAYFGLISCINDSGLGEYGNVLKRIEKAMNICKQENKKLCLRECKLFVAEILVLQREYSDALKIYEELVEENILDCRPYLCQGIVYTLLKKPKEAKKCFESYGIIGPKGHPYVRQFEGVIWSLKVIPEFVYYHEMYVSLLHFAGKNLALPFYLPQGTLV
ncbi:protein SLOW GREEN 1, chloroplastic-like [Papaver somniferum]|uniref:protein SLOW GREEN 1, chloroplastic-like n=1 Tax=Papaver somniferum TaxID=3469 RepID=UPI000E703C8E|nr:protein SLOW GREEN 1, chloroplastic-like [Papaver somniferum]